MTRVQIKIENVSFRYSKSNKDNLLKVSSTIEAGERVALIGHNGSGKTTLAKHLNGLLQPQHGRILIGNCPITGDSVAQCARKVALLFQNPDDQICMRRVYDEVAFGPKNLGHPFNRSDILVKKALDLFDLSPLTESNPYDLGYSERKRLAMASIIAMDTPILVFDEPTAGLDEREISLYIGAIQNLQAEGKSVLMITHDMDFVAEHIPRAICLNNGAIVYDGFVETLFNNRELLSSCGLRPPQIFQLSRHFHQTPRALTPEQFVSSFSRFPHKTE